VPTSLATRALGPVGPARTLVEAQLVTALGNGLFLSSFALYTIRVVGLSPAQLGIVLSVAAVVALFAGVPFGHLADLHGARGVTAALHVLAGLLTLVVLLPRSFPLFLVAVCVYMVSYRGANAAKAGLTMTVLKGDVLVVARARIQAVNNFGLSVGAAAGAIVLTLNTPTAYLTGMVFNAASFIGCGLMMLRLPAVPRTTPRAAGEPRLRVLRDYPYAVVAFINAIMLAHSPLLEVILPLWVVLHTDAPRGLVAILVVLNTVAVVLMQVRLTKGVDTLARSVRAFRLSGLILGAACIAYAASSANGVLIAILLLIVATVLHVLGEMIHSAGSWVVAFELAPADRQGQYQGLFSTGLSMIQIIGPAVLTLLLINGGVLGWGILAAVFVVAGLAMAPAARWAERTRPAATATPPAPEARAPAEAAVAEESS
jgi:MFS family permease